MAVYWPTPGFKGWTFNHQDVKDETFDSSVLTAAPPQTSAHFRCQAKGVCEEQCDTTEHFLITRRVTLAKDKQDKHAWWPGTGNEMCVIKYQLNVRYEHSVLTPLQWQHTNTGARYDFPIQVYTDLPNGWGKIFRQVPDITFLHMFT